MKIGLEEGLLKALNCPAIAKLENMTAQISAMTLAERVLVKGVSDFTNFKMEATTLIWDKANSNCEVSHN